jgi:hypothetical protein
MIWAVTGAPSSLFSHDTLLIEEYFEYINDGLSLNIFINGDKIGKAKEWWTDSWCIGRMSHDSHG